MVFSTEERYLASHGTSKYGCDNCKKNKECSQGFYRCLEHFHDLCEDCFVKANGTAAVVPKCGDCKLPLVFSTAERYRASHGTGEYACDDCRESKECRTGYYRCMNHKHDFCEACFVKQGG